MNDEDTGAFNTYFVVKNEDFNKAKAIFDEAEKIYYDGEYGCSLYEILIELLEDSQIEYASFSQSNVDYEI